MSSHCKQEQVGQWLVIPLVLSKVVLDPETKTHPLVIDHIAALGDVAKVDSHARAEDEALFALLRKLSKTFGTRDLIEEFVA